MLFSLRRISYRQSREKEKAVSANFIFHAPISPADPLFFRSFEAVLSIGGIRVLFFSNENIS
jgi:hypothetical protein